MLALVFRRKRRGVPAHPCLSAPAEWKCKVDPAIPKFHQQLLHLYGASAQGKLTKTFFNEAYDNIRADPRNAVPPPYHGQYPPRPKFMPGCPAPLIMWPHDPENEQRAVLAAQRHTEDLRVPPGLQGLVWAGVAQRPRLQGQLTGTAPEAPGHS